MGNNFCNLQILREDVAYFTMVENLRAHILVLVQTSDLNNRWGGGGAGIFVRALFDYVAVS